MKNTNTNKVLIMEKIIGLIDAPFTPFYENGDVNLEPIPAYAAMLQKNGLKGVFINGSSGEGYMLTPEERMRLAEAWMAAAPENFKVIVHVGSCCVRESRRLAEHAQKIGAWGIGAMAPPFPKIGRIEELVKYIEEIAAGAPELPFYYYHIPAFNGAFLPMEKLLEAVDGRVPNFAGIKYTFESLYEYNQCRLYKDGKYDMLHGQDETILPCLAMGGARGGIGGTTNYNGKNLVGIIEAWRFGVGTCFAELFAGGHQHHLSLPRQHRRRQAHHETHRTRPRPQPYALPEHHARGRKAAEEGAGRNRLL